METIRWRGVHIRVYRGGYYHHGVLLDGRRVAHYAGFNAQGGKDAVQITTLDQFAKGGRVEVVVYAKQFDAATVVRRALWRLDEDKYNLISNNCETYARWVVTGHATSQQVVRAVALTGGSLGTAVVASGGVAAVATVTAAGMTGAAATTTALSAAGLGLGAVAGVSALVAAPAALGVGAFSAAMRDDPCLPAAEREARRRAKKAALIAAGVGVAAALALVYFAGTRGFSAAGITSGLRACGGSMRSGVALLGSGVAVAAVLAGTAAYCTEGGNAPGPSVTRSRFG